MPQEPLVPLTLNGVLAYCDHHRSVEPGDTLNFYVSADEPYHFSVVRLGTNLDAPGPDDVQVYPQGTPPQSAALVQPIHPGSYIHVEDGITQALTTLTVECWVRPWTVTGQAGVLTQYTYDVACGFGLFMLEGNASFFVGNGTTEEAGTRLVGPALGLREWAHLVGTYDGTTAVLYVNGKAVAHNAYAGGVAGGDAPLRIGAAGAVSGTARQTTDLLTGDVSSPVLYSRALTAGDVRERYKAQGLDAPTGADILAYWPFAEESGTAVADAGGAGRTGTLVNRGTWEIGGPSYDSSVEPLAGYDPNTAPKRGHGIRLACDDLYDCGWTPTFQVPVGEEWASGLYVGRFYFDNEHCDLVYAPYDVTFVVRRAPKKAQKKLLVICSMSSWRAYSTAPFSGTRGWDPYNGITPNLTAPQFGLYFDHQWLPTPTPGMAYQPVYQVGLNMPWPSAGPYVIYYNPPTTSDPNIYFSHLARAERFVHVWLAENGYEFDMASDMDLDADPALLTGYTTVMFCGHHEYWTRNAHTAVDTYLSTGGPGGLAGSALVLAGNVLMWRTTLDLENGIMECRKYPSALAGGNTNAEPGEIFHSLDPDHGKGGTARGCGMPCYTVLGLDCLGTTGTALSYFYPYEVVDPTHWLFAGAEFKHTDPFTKKSLFGYGPFGAQGAVVPVVVGDEWDVRLTAPLMSSQGGTPPPEPAGIVTVASCTVANLPTAACRNWDEDFLSHTGKQRDLICELIYWLRPQGGQVVYAGSISAGWAIRDDQPLHMVVTNALARFGVTSPTNPTTGADTTDG